MMTKAHIWFCCVLFTDTIVALWVTLLIFLLVLITGSRTFNAAAARKPPITWHGSSWTCKKTWESVTAGGRETERRRLDRNMRFSMSRSWTAVLVQHQRDFRWSWVIKLVSIAWKPLNHCFIQTLTTAYYDNYRVLTECCCWPYLRK